MANRTRPRGFTLLELMIALAVSSVVIAGVVGAALAQQRAYYGAQRMRAAQSSARTALLFIEEKVRLAGFGMDPALAFDFGVYAPPAGTCPAEANGCARDSVSDNDELVFYARNPNYWVPNDIVGNPVGRAWLISNVSSTSMTITAHGGEVFPAGQIVAAVCPGGRYYAYMTVAATTPAGGAPAAAGPLQLPLAASDRTNPFRRQDLAVAPGSDPATYFNASVSAFASPPTPSACFTSGARLFQIDRYRFHVRPVVVGGFPGGKIKYDPYLVLDMGVDTNFDGVIDASDELVIAEGVEIMQVAYSMANLALPTPTVGLNPGTVIALTPGLPGSTTIPDEITLTAKLGVQVPASLPLSFQYAPTLQPADNAYAATSWYSYTLTQPLPTTYPRQTDSQANIRRVRVGLVVRSPEPDTRAPTTVPLDANFRLYNLSTVPAWISANAYPGVQDGYERVQVEASVLVPNMTDRGMIFF